MRKNKLRKDGEDTIVVVYETIINGEIVEGSLIMHGRLEENLR